MSDNQILKLLSESQGLVHLICCMICFLYSKRLNKPVLLFFFYLFFLLIMNYSMSKMADLRVNNLALTHFVVIGEFIFLSVFFKEILTNNVILKKYFKHYLVLIGGLIAINSIYFEEINSFNTNAKVLVLFLVLFFATNFFYDRSKRLMEIDANERALRLINSAILLYYSGSFFIYLFYKITQDLKFYSDKILIVNATLYLIFIILILIAILQLIFQSKKRNLVIYLLHLKLYTTMIKLGIIDDEDLFRKGLRRLIEDIEDTTVLLEASNGQDLLDQLENLKINHQELPDIVLLDLEMPVLNGVETAKALQEFYPDIKIIVLSSHFSKAFVLNMIEVGAAAHMSKKTSLVEMQMTIQKVAEKGYYYNEQVIGIITENLRKREKPKVSFTENLTPREQEVLQLICEQLTAQEIADKLFISRRTVEGHRNNLLLKFNCRNIAGLVVFALQNELVKLKPSQFW